VIALHGRNGNAAGVMDLGVQDALTQAVKIGWPPFAVVSVDGGNSYWHKRASGEDTGAMVLTELLPILSSQGLDTSRVAFLGWSMGGYGALRLGAWLGPARTAAICAVSPALWTSFMATDPGAFDSVEDYEAIGSPVYAWRDAVARDGRTGAALNGVATVDAWRALGGARVGSRGLVTE